MIFLLDWSGSMSSYMKETVEQVISLAMFCHKINIPYQVFAFTDGYSRIPDDSTLKIDKDGIDSTASVTLLELFDHRMNTRDFNTMIELLLDCPWLRCYDSKYGLHGTPLNQALLYMVDYVSKFVRNNDVEKMNIITLTDGESNGLSKQSSLERIKSGRERIYENGTYRYRNTTSILRDTVTKKEYVITDDSCQQTGVLLNLLKDRYGLRSIGFYITNNRLANLERIAKTVMGVESHSDRTSIAVKIQEAMRKDKGAILKDAPGRDQMYVIPSDMKIVDDELEDVTQDMSASQISKQLTRMFSSRKSSRVVLNSFIGVVA